MSNINIDKKSYGRTEFFNGTYTTDISDTDDEAKIRDYYFTISVYSDLDDDMIEVSTVTWLDGEPPNADLAIDTISEHFFDKII